jgi:hypothetical protein
MSRQLPNSVKLFNRLTAIIKSTELSTFEVSCMRVILEKNSTDEEYLAVVLLLETLIEKKMPYYIGKATEIIDFAYYDGRIIDRFREIAKKTIFDYDLILTIKEMNHRYVHHYQAVFRKIYDSIDDSEKIKQIHQIMLIATKAENYDTLLSGAALKILKHLLDKGDLCAWQGLKDAIIELPSDFYVKMFFDKIGTKDVEEKNKSIFDKMPLDELKDLVITDRKIALILSCHIAIFNEQCDRFSDIFIYMLTSYAHDNDVLERLWCSIFSYGVAGGGETNYMLNIQCALNALDEIDGIESFKSSILSRVSATIEDDNKRNELEDWNIFK